MDDTAKKIIQKHISDMNSLAGGTPDRYQRPLMAQIQFIIAEEQAKTAEKVERQTNKLIGLTWALVALTTALFLLTAYLSYDAYLKSKSYDMVYPNTTQK